MIAILVEVFDLAHLVQEIEDSDFDDFDTFREDFTKASSLSECPRSFLLFLFLLIFDLSLQPPNKLDLEHYAIAIIHVSKAICTSYGQCLVDPIEVVIVGRWDVQESLKVLCVNLVLN